MRGCGDSTAGCLSTTMGVGMLRGMMTASAPALSDVKLVIHEADYLEGRSFADNPDIINGKQIHAIYLLPCEREDRRFDINSNIEFSLLAINLNTDVISSSSDI